MGSFLSSDVSDKQGNPSSLLMPVGNPINRFCDDFASNLVEDNINNNSKNELIEEGTEVFEMQGYAILKKIGEGAEAAVYSASKMGTTDIIALKVFRKDKRLGSEKPREIEIASALHHPHCLPIFNSFLTPSSEYVISMPLAKYGAFEVTKRPELSIYDAVRFLHQIGSALEYMHENGYVHRDIKPQNVLIFETGFALCDFSVSTKLHNPDELLTGEIGTSFFMSPQVSNQEQYKPKPADMWSLGVTIFVLIYGTYPYDLQKIYDNASQSMLKNNVSRIQPLGELEFPEYPTLPTDLKNILRKLLDKDPDTRMTASELVNHPYIQKYKNNWNNIISLMEEDDSYLSGKA